MCTCYCYGVKKTFIVSSVQQYWELDFGRRILCTTKDDDDIMGLHGELEFKRIVQSQIVKGFDPFLRPPLKSKKKIFLDFVANSKTFLSCTFILISIQGVFLVSIV